MRSTGLIIQQFRESVTKISQVNTDYQESFFALVQELRDEHLTPMTARRLMLEAGLKPQRVNEMFALARMPAVDYRRFRERFIGFKAVQTTVRSTPPSRSIRQRVAAILRDSKPS